MNPRDWVVLLLGALVYAAPVAAQDARIVHVPADYATIAEALSAVPDGATIEVEPGEYAESLRIERPVILRGGTGEVIINGTGDRPVVEITRTVDVTVRGLTLRGGQYGILVTRSQGVMIRNNTIQDNRLVGVKVRMGSADIIGNTVSDTLPPYGQGIHITNTMNWPTSTIRGNVISDNAMSGITTNMAMVRITDNTVTGNGQRGIAVTEMSEAVVAENTVDGNAENGIMVFDQSWAIVCNNTIIGSQLPQITGEGRYGNGITVDFHSQAELHNNVIVDNANHAVSVLGSSQVDVSDNIVRGNGSNGLWADQSSASLRNVDLPQSCQ